MPTAFFVSHPEVVVQPNVPVPRWSLSDRGIARIRAFASSPVVQGLGSVWARQETKAIEAAGILAAHFGLPVQVHPGLHENDRSATGFLDPGEFELTADAFFAQPDGSIRGWERGIDAQARVTAAVKDILALPRPSGDIAVVSHGAVGNLLLCHYLDVPISRDLDQPFQGHFWAFDIGSRGVLHLWRPIAPRL